MSVGQPTPILVEQRFPLDLDDRHHAIRALYETAKGARWDPFRDFEWSAIGASAFPAATREAVRLGYSRRLWQEYTGLAETPALLIRFCLEAGREADPKYYLTTRNTEEAWHIECFSAIADTCGGMVAEPQSGEFAAVFNQRRDRLALHADTLLDAYVATYCALEDELEFALAEAAAANASNPVLRAVTRQVVTDRQRHAEFGWLYAASRSHRWIDAERAAIAASVTAYVTDNVFAGYQCVGLAAPGVADEFAAAESTLATAGLGGVPPEVEVQVLRATLERARQRFAPLGISIPALDHPRAGRF